MDSPSGRHVVGEGGRGPDLPGQAEVGNFDDVGAARQDVLRLQVAVEEAQPMHVREALRLGRRTVSFSLSLGTT